LARRSDARAGFTLVETAIALAIAALFCGAVAVTVADLLRADELAMRRREAVLWHETVASRRALGLDALAEPWPADDWIAEVDDAPPAGGAPRAEGYRFSPANRPSMVETLRMVP